MNELLIRDAQPSEQAAIRELTLTAYQEYAPVLAELWEIYRQNIVDTLANFSPATQMVAMLKEQLVGSVLLYPAGSTFTRPDGTQAALTWPEIRLLAVAPNTRGLGVGGALVDECLKRARQAQATTLTLHTTDMMQVAMRMYERMGFVRAPELDVRPAPGVIVKGYRYDLTAKI